MKSGEVEFLVQLVSGGSAVMEADPAPDPGTQARQILKQGATVVHEDGSWTIHPVHQIKSVTVQPKGTGTPPATFTTFRP